MLINWRDRLSGRPSPEFLFFSTQLGFISLQQVGGSGKAGVGGAGLAAGRNAKRLAARQKAILPRNIQFFFCMMLVFECDESREGNVTVFL